MSFDPETGRMFCDRCSRAESSDDDVYGWAIIDGQYVCAGCHTVEEHAVEQAAAEKVTRLFEDPRGRAILKMAFREQPTITGVEANAAPGESA